MPFNLMSDDNKTIIFQSKYSRSFTRDELVAMNKLSLEEKIKITNDIVDEFLHGNKWFNVCCFQWWERLYCNGRYNSKEVS